MKSFVSFFAFFYIISFSAQPTITSSEALSSSLSIITANNVLITNLNVSPGPSGANVTWNFSAYTSTNSGTTVNSGCPNTAHCNQFPTANRIANRLDNNSYYEINSTEANAIGTYNSISGDKVIFSDPKKGFQFPITYGQTFTDTYSYYLQGNPDVTTGTVTSEVDAYGTLITPYGTRANVLRIKRIDNYVIPNLLPGIPGYFSDETYEWISDYGYPILLYRIANGSGGGVSIPTVKELVYTSHIAELSTNENSLKNKISISPNPAQDEIQILETAKITEVQIINFEGKLIKKVNPINKKIIVSNLPRGNYLLKIITDKEVITEKFIKE